MQEQSKKSIFKTYLIYFISLMLFCGVRIISSLGLLDGVKAPWNDILFTSIIQIGIMFLIPFTLYMLFLRVTPKQVFKTCNFYKPTFSVVLTSLALGVVLFFINLVVSSIFGGIVDFTGYHTPFYFGEVVESDYGIGSFFLNVLLVAILPALCEEFLHRGLLLQGTKHSGFYRAIVISSICFGLIHLNIGQVAYATVLGLIMGFCSVVAKNIWVSVIMHFVNNFIAIYLEFAVANGWFLGGYTDWLARLGELDLWLICIICFIALCVIAILLFYLVLALYKQSILRKVNRAIERVYDKDVNISDKPVAVDKNRIIHEMLENNTMINLNYEEMKSPIEMVMPKQKEVYKPNFKDNIFLVCTLFLGGLVTIFTFVWGFI